jgi:hypothetical protein
LFYAALAFFCITLLSQHAPAVPHFICFVGEIGNVGNVMQPVFDNFSANFIVCWLLWG